MQRAHRQLGNLDVERGDLRNLGLLLRRARRLRGAGGGGPAALYAGEPLPTWSNGGEIGERPLEAARSSPRGGGGAPSGWASLWECRAARGRQARAEEAQGGEPGR